MVGAVVDAGEIKEYEKTPNTQIGAFTYSANEALVARFLPCGVFDDMPLTPLVIGSNLVL